MAVKVLVVDDSPNVRRLVALALAGEDFEILEACDGAEGLAMIRAAPDLGLVICDVNMPRMTGIEMIESIECEALVAPPIIVLTAEGRSTLVRRAAAAGAKAWIVKPFKPKLLLAAVRKLLGAAASSPHR